MSIKHIKIHKLPNIALKMKKPELVPVFEVYCRCQEFSRFGDAETLANRLRMEYDNLPQKIARLLKTE